MKLKSILLVSASMLMFGDSYGQSKVTTNGQKYVLVEEGTGTWCQWCPDGAQVIQEDLLPAFPRVVVASFHNRTSDSMTLPGDPFNNGTGYMTSFPGGAVDRVNYTSPLGTDVNIYRRYWDDAVTSQMALTPNFDVSMECVYNDSTRVLSVKVTAKALVALTGNYRMTAYITQDSIPSNKTGYKQTSASGLNNPGSMSESGSPSWFIGKGLTLQDSNVYSHMDVVRKILATDSIWGDAAFTNPTLGQTVTKTYTYTLPTTIRGSLFHSKSTKVIGAVLKYGSTITDRPVENVISAKVRWMKKSVVSVDDVSKHMLDVELYPNPAVNTITIRGMLENPTATKIAIYNVTGQLILEKEFQKTGSLFGETISLNGINNGTYYMTITNEGESVTKQFIIAR